MVRSPRTVICLYDDATAIKKLKAAGAIILAKTTLPDFATAWFCFCSKIGETKNPYVLARGSRRFKRWHGWLPSPPIWVSSVSTSDTGGSIRLPSSFTNLVGVRVTPGLIQGPQWECRPWSYSRTRAGPMARTVRDAAILLDSMIGYDSGR